jgi:hypothetical protein
MADPVTMAMVGAAIGGGGSLLSGKSLGKSLKNAAIGGTLGYGGGALLGSAGAGAATTAGTTAGTGAGLSQGAGGLLGATGAAGSGASLAVPTIAEGAVAANTMIPYSAEIGMANSFNPITGAPIATEASSFAPAMFANAPSAGGLTALNSGVAAPSTFATMFGNMKDLATIDNLKGAAQVANMYQPTPLQAAPSGSIKVGQAPTGDIYDELRKYGYTLPKRRETNFSLLG